MADKPDLKVLGETGLPLWSGRVYDETLPVLQGERGRKVYREMSEQDPLIGGILFAIEMLSRQIKWTVVPADDSSEAEKVAEFVDGALKDMNPTWEDTLSEILSMLVYGWSWFEMLYKHRNGSSDSPLEQSQFDDGKIGWRAWAIRSQETHYQWIYDDQGELESMKQIPPPNYQTLTVPRKKSLHFRTKSRRQNPEGVSILRTAYRAWYLKKNIEAIEGIGVERDLAGLPVIWVPPNLLSSTATADEQNLLAVVTKIVTNIRRDEQEGIVMPLQYDEAGHPTYDLKLLSTGGTRQFDTDKIVNRYDQRIAMSMMADFILLGHDAVGSFALSNDKTALFAIALGTILDAIAAEINMSGIPQLVRYNGWGLDLVPKLEHGDLESSDLSKLGPFLQQLSSAGMVVFPNPELEKFLLEQAGLPSTLPDLSAQQDQASLLLPEEAAGLANITPQDMQAMLGPANGGSTNGNTPPSQPARPAARPVTAAEPTGSDVHVNVPLGVRQQAMGTFTKNVEMRVKKQMTEMLRAKTGMEPTTEMVDKEYHAWSQQHLGPVLAQASATFNAQYDPEGVEIFHGASTHHRHYASFNQRISKLSERLRSRMSSAEYAKFLEESMTAGSYSKMSKQYQELIRQTERETYADGEAVRS